MEDSTTANKVGRVAIATSFAIVFAIFAAVYCLVAIKLHDPATLNLLVLRPLVGATDYYSRELSPSLKKKVFFIPACDGSKIDAWFFKVDGSDKLTIVNHGNAGNLANRFYLAKVLTQAHSNVLMYDYRGYGLSTGVATVPGILQDGLTVYDYARQKLGYAPDKIILYGESIGTAVTCNIAKNRECAAVILQSGIGSLPAVGRSLMPFLWLFPDVLFAEPHLDNVAVVHDIHVPILFCHGAIDRIVPCSESKRMFANANEPKQLVVLPDCGHNDMGVQNKKEFYDAIGNFVACVK
ncbi:MAG TPA: alpha/beta fold hydrolase [Planktothrix sp.]